MSRTPGGQSHPLRTALVDATVALLDEAATGPERRAILCEKYVDNLLGTLQVAGVLALKDRGIGALIPPERNYSC